MSTTHRGWTKSCIIHSVSAVVLCRCLFCRTEKVFCANLQKILVSLFIQFCAVLFQSYTVFFIDLENPWSHNIAVGKRKLLIFSGALQVRSACDFHQWLVCDSDDAFKQTFKTYSCVCLRTSRCVSGCEKTICHVTSRFFLVICNKRLEDEIL